MYSIHADSSIVWFQYEWVGPSHTWTGTCTMAMSLRWIGPMRHTKNTQKSPTTPRELTEKQNSWAKKHSWEHPSQKAKWFFLWCQEITYGENKIPLQKAPDSSNRISTLRPKETIAPWFHVGRWCNVFNHGWPANNQHLMPYCMDLSAFGTVKR